MTDPLGQSQVIPYLTGLAKKEYSFHLISCEKEINYSKHKDQISDLLKESNITWHPISYSKKPPILATLWDIYRIKQKAYLLHKSLNFSIVHCRSYVASLIGLKMKKNLGIKFIFDMRGFWADERVEGGLWKLSNPFYKTIFNYFRRKEAAFLSNADYTISLTEKAKKIILQRKDLRGQLIPIKVIPCCVDLDHFSRLKIRQEDVWSLKKKIGVSPDDFVLSYLGSIGTWYCIYEMLEFFKLLLNSNPKAKFLFITPDDPDTIFTISDKIQIPRDRIITCFAPYSQVPLHLAVSDISIFFIKPTFSKSASSPTKLGELMAMEIPIICNSGIGDVDTIVKEDSHGIILKNFSKYEYEKAILAITNQPCAPVRKTKLPDLDLFSLRTGIHKYEEVYMNLR